MVLLFLALFSFWNETGFGYVSVFGWYEVKALGVVFVLLMNRAAKRILFSNIRFELFKYCRFKKL